MIIFIQDGGIDDDDEVEEVHAKQKHGAADKEDSESDDTVVYMVDGDKVVLLGKEWLGNSLYYYQEIKLYSYARPFLIMSCLMVKSLKIESHLILGFFIYFL